MRWLSRDLWKAGIAIAGMLLLLVLMVWIPISAAGAREEASGLATIVTVQATPTEDATVTALNKEKLAQEIQQLKNQNAPDIFGWLRTNAAVLLSTPVVVIGGLIGLFRWLGDRRYEQEKRREDQRSEQEKRAEERFQAVVEGLGSERNEAKVGAAILLRTFLRPGYEQFYIQTFDLTVAHLRLRPSADPDNPLPLTTLRQALIVAFKEAFPLARDEWIKKLKGEPFDPQFLDASHIQLDNAFLWKADLKQVFIPAASLRATDLSDAKLSGAQLWWIRMDGARLGGADLSGANLGGTNIEAADYLQGTDLRGIVNLEKEKLEACKAKGAIID